MFQIILIYTLQILCRDIFLSGWQVSGLLTNFQPASVRSKLKILLDDCKSETFGTFPMSHSNVQHVMYELEQLLDQSLKTETV